LNLFSLGFFWVAPFMGGGQAAVMPFQQPPLKIGGDIYSPKQNLQF